MVWIDLNDVWDIIILNGKGFIQKVKKWTNPKRWHLISQVLGLVWPLVKISLIEPRPEYAVICYFNS